MTNVPRRLPPTQGQRIRNVTVTHASLSGQGRTAAARPVSQSRPAAQIYRPPTTGGVITGQVGGTFATSITTTTAGAGNSVAANGNVAIGYNAQAVAVAGDMTRGGNATAVGLDSYAHGVEAVALGFLSDANGADALCIGVADAVGNAAVAIGTGTYATGSPSMAIGAQSGNVTSTVQARADGAVAIGADSHGLGAQALNANDFVLGTTNHHVKIPGALILADSSGGLHRLVVGTDGSLSTVAYP